MNYSFKHLLLAGISMLASGSVYAQVTTSSLSGRIVDESGEPVIGAAVVAVHEPSGTSYGAVVNNSGQYTINGMRTGGPYKVEVSALGYTTVVFKDITLQLAEVSNINATLKESSEFLEEVVVIGTAASKFSTEKTGAATNISNSQITSLPTVSRSLTDVTRLSPYGGNGMTFVGSDGRTANFTVDGANFNNNFGLNEDLPGGGNPISIDAIEEMQVVISPYDVRQTDFIGGGVNAITKSGTNTFKGSAYVYHKHENLRGDTIDGQQITSARDKDRNTIYGATFGGPIIKNKLFFFVNFEYSKTPTVANRWRASTDGVMLPEDFVSRTTEADLQKISDFVKNKYGYDTGSYKSFPADESNMKALARIDWNINEKNHLSVRYNYTMDKSWTATNATSMDGGSRSAYARFSQYSMAYANSMYSSNKLATTVAAELNSRISNNLSNRFIATFSKLDDRRGSNSNEFPFIDIRNDDGSEILPYISLGYELFTWNNGVHNNVFNVKNDLTYYVGNHTITGGLSYEYQMADNSYMRNGTGYYRYRSMDDFMEGAAPEIVCLTYGYNGETSPAARVRYNKAGLYAQDEWSITDKFKLTYGLRLDGLFFSNKDLMHNNKIYNLDYAGRHIDTGKWPSSKVYFSPRIGFTYDILGDKSLKLRGGTGLFTGRLPLVFFTNMPTSSGMVQYQAQLTNTKANPNLMDNFKGGLVTDANGKATIDALRDKLVSLGYPSTISPADGTLPSTISAVDPKFKMPQVWKTSVAIDYSFPTSFPFSISAEGIFNKAVNAVTMEDYSVKPVNGFAHFNGADNRPIFQDYKYMYVDDEGKTVNMPSAFVLSNTSKGYGYSANVTVNMTPIKELNLMAAYTHTVSKEVTGMPGNNASSVMNYIFTVNGPNDPGLHNSQYVTPDRFIAALTHNDKCGNHFSFIYETWRGGSNYSYGMVNDINGDGYNYDSIYIPTDEEVAKGDFRFVSDGDRDRFMAFVHKDKYLSKHQGDYAEAYSVYSPWVHRVDFSYKHDFRIKAGKTMNVLQLSFDIKNLLNLFNSSWGVSKYMNPELNSGRILEYKGIDKEGYATFSTPKAVSGNTKIWEFNHAIGQCWYASIGIKYMFN